MTIDGIYCSSKIKENTKWNDIQSAVELNNLSLKNEIQSIVICEKSELAFYIENSSNTSSLICLELDESLFLPESEIDDGGRFIYSLGASQLELLPNLVSLNISTQQKISENRRGELILKSISEVNEFEIIKNKFTYESILNIKAYLGIYKSIDKALENYNEYLKTYEKRISFELTKGILEENESRFLIPLDNNYFINIKLEKNKLDQEDKSIILATLQELKDFFDECGIKNEKTLESFWQNIFSVFPLPMAIITTNGELLYHNNLFSKLSLLPKQCIEFESNQKVEVNDEYYICHKEQVDFDEESLFYFRFHGVQQSEHESYSKKQGSFEDLGIISSSIAHELNNPLAGILSALEVLLLIGEESEELKELKKAASRCKELVGVFLGFAKSRPSYSDESCSLESLFNNALSLLRFRMVETNVRFEIDITQVSVNEVKLNPSILTMIYYLILSDILTEYEHKKLVTDSDQTFSVIKGSFSYNDQSMRIELSENFISFKETKFNKLINNLLLLEDLKWENGDNYLQLSV